jgi:hypothetical protein
MKILNPKLEILNKPMNLKSQSKDGKIPLSLPFAKGIGPGEQGKGQKLGDFVDLQ